MIKKKFFDNKLLIILTFIFSIICILNFNNFPGNKILFLIYNISCIILTFYLFRKNITGFEFFLYGFFLLSFWLKFSFVLYFNEIEALEGNFNPELIDFNEIILVIISVFFACIFSSILKERITDNFFLGYQSINFKNNFLKFYSKYRLLILCLLIIFLLSIYIANYQLNIYRKGLINNEIHNLVLFFFSWGYTYGFSLIVSIIIYIDYLIYKNKNYFFIGIIECFLTTTSMYSRAFIIYVLAYLKGFFELYVGSNKINFKDYFNYKIITLLVSVILIFFISFYFTSKLRNNNFYNTTENLKFTSQINHIKSLAIYRWIGIDGLVAVSQSNKLSFDLFKSALKEKKSPKKYNSFYINNFFKTIKQDNDTSLENQNLRIVITPGIIAFLYYSGSISFVVVSITLLISALVIFERIFYVFSKGNVILSNIIGFSLAYRLIHYGYLPYNTINFLFSYFLILILLFFLFKFIFKK